MVPLSSKCKEKKYTTPKNQDKEIETLQGRVQQSAGSAGEGQAWKRENITRLSETKPVDTS